MSIAGLHGLQATAFYCICNRQACLQALWRGGGERAWYTHAVCACSVTLRVLEDRILWYTSLASILALWPSFLVVRVPAPSKEEARFGFGFGWRGWHPDYNIPRTFRDKERMAGLDGSIFERDFETAVAMRLVVGFWLGTAIARIQRARYHKGQEVIPYLCMCFSVSLLYTW